VRNCDWSLWQAPDADVEARRKTGLPSAASLLQNSSVFRGATGTRRLSLSLQPHAQAQCNQFLDECHQDRIKPGSTRPSTDVADMYSSEGNLWLTGWNALCLCHISYVQCGRATSFVKGCLLKLHGVF
jgi:hypothetical protein